MQGLQEWATDQIFFLVDLLLYRIGIGARLRSAHVQELRSVVPFVQGFTLLHAVVALQTDEGTRQDFCQGFGKFGFTDARLAF